MFGRFAFLGSAALVAIVTWSCSSSTATATAGGPSTPQTTPKASLLAQQQQAGGAEATNAIPCTAREVSLTPGSDNGAFNGMSHSGTSLTLANKSRSACSVPGMPQLTFVDANGPVNTQADLSGANFMHPVPQVLPIVLQPKQSITTGARWVSGPVFSDNLCYKLTGVTLGLREGGTHMPLSGQMCGERSKGVHYDLQRYSPGAKQ